MISKMLKMQMLEDEDDLAYAETEKKARTDSTSDGRPAWMRTLHTTASNWLHLIPQTLSHLKRTVENIKVAGRGRGHLGGPRSGQVRARAPLGACGRLRPNSGVKADLLPGLHVHERGEEGPRGSVPPLWGARPGSHPLGAKSSLKSRLGASSGGTSSLGPVRSCGRTSSSQTLPFTQAFSSL